MNEKFLPIGTVVKLKGGTKKIMITSYLVFPNNRNGKRITINKRASERY